MKSNLFLKRMISASFLVIGATGFIALYIGWFITPESTYLKFIWDNLPLYIKGIFL
jgi:hypothetical protein